MSSIRIFSILAILCLAVWTARCADAATLADNGNDTATDSRTGLVWQQREPGAMTLEAALTYCEELSLGGRNDWRLPNVKELESLTDDTRYSPAIDPTYFPDTTATPYWSSSTYARNTSIAWGVDFYFGRVISIHKYNIDSTQYESYSARCVCGGLSESVTAIYGTVTDQATGLPVVGAIVTINTALNSTTNTDGNYTFGTLPAATYSITVSKTGYQNTGTSGIVVTATSPAKADILMATIGTSPFDLTVTMPGDGNGSVHSSPMTDISCIKGSSNGCSGKFGNVTVTLTASPDITTTVFNGWTGACTTTEKDCTFFISKVTDVAATFIMAPKTKLTTGATDGFPTLKDAYRNAGSTIFALEGVFMEDWTLDLDKNITFKGGYLADYGPTGNGFTVLNGKLSIKNGSLKVDGLKIRLSQ